MDSKEIMEMEVGPEFDALVAVHIMKWKPVSYPGNLIYWDEGEQGPIPGGKFCPRFSDSFKPSTNAEYDYEVLLHLRGTYNGPGTFTRDFHQALENIWSLRWNSVKYFAAWVGFMLYQPGDYSRAALLATLEAESPKAGG